MALLLRTEATIPASAMRQINDPPRLPRRIGHLQWDIKLFAFDLQTEIEIRFVYRECLTRFGDINIHQPCRSTTSNDGGESGEK